MNTSLYREQPPSASLASWVECAWFLESRAAIYSHRVPPDGCLDIIYDRHTGLRAVGAMTREQRFDFPRGAYVAGIRFRPGMAGPFLGVSPAQLTECSAPLEHLWSRRARELTRQLDDSSSMPEAMRILLASLRPPISPPNPVQRAITAIAAAHGDADLNYAASHAGLSPRHFRRRCLEETGLTPKLLCRVLRFRYVSRIARAFARPNWSAIALQGNYFDQSHFIRDFHHFTGLSPMAVFSNTRPRLRN